VLALSGMTAIPRDAGLPGTHKGVPLPIHIGRGPLDRELTRTRESIHLPIMVSPVNLTKAFRFLYQCAFKEVKPGGNFFV
jgi:hypothetical protein